MSDPAQQLAQMDEAQLSPATPPSKATGVPSAGTPPKEQQPQQPPITGPTPADVAMTPAPAPASVTSADQELSAPPPSAASASPAKAASGSSPDKAAAAAAGAAPAAAAATGGGSDSSISISAVCKQSGDVSKASSGGQVVSEEEPLTEDEIIRRKLMFDGDGGGDDRRLNTLMKTFFQWQRADAGTRDRSLMYERMLVMLDDAEMAMKKSTLVQGMNERELLQYESLNSSLQRDIDRSKQQIQIVKQDLEKAKIIRKNRMEYDPIVAQIKEFPTRKQTQAKIESLVKQASQLSHMISELDRRMDVRRQQFADLTTAAQDLQSCLAQDETLVLELLPDDSVTEGPLEPPPSTTTSSAVHAPAVLPMPVDQPSLIKTPALAPAPSALQATPAHAPASAVVGAVGDAGAGGGEKRKHAGH